MSTSRARQSAFRTGARQPGLTALIDRAAALIDGLEEDDRFASLQLFLEAACRFDNFIVYLFTGCAPPQLLGTSVPEQRLRSEMTEFVAGLFLLDPFIVAADRGATGLVRLDDVTPEAFRESEYFRRHYCHTNVVDELRYLVPLDSRRMVHVFVEREQPRPAFSRRDCDRLRKLSPLVAGFIRGRCRWQDRITRSGSIQTPTINLKASIASMASGALTRRECEIVELILKGYSAKLIGHALGIEEGTVTNHKRNIYSKLSIHSVSQLVDLFLRSIC